MVTGHNLNLRHGDKVYHVQTEDKGRPNPVIETLVYIQGRIIHQEQQRYDDINGPEYTEAEVSRRVEAQHQSVIAAIRSGRFDQPSAEPFGEEYVSDRPFDQVVLDYLAEQSKAQALALEVVQVSAFQQGQPASVTVRTLNRETKLPIAGAHVRLRVVAAGSEPDEGVKAMTNAVGEAELSFVVPRSAGQAAAIVQAEAAEGTDEVNLLLR